MNSNGISFHVTLRYTASADDRSPATASGDDELVTACIMSPIIIPLMDRQSTRSETEANRVSPEEHYGCRRPRAQGRVPLYGTRVRLRRRRGRRKCRA